ASVPVDGASPDSAAIVKAWLRPRPQKSRAWDFCPRPGFQLSQMDGWITRISRIVEHIACHLQYKPVHQILTENFAHMFPQKPIRAKLLDAIGNLLRHFIIAHFNVLLALISEANRHDARSRQASRRFFRDLA